MRHRRKGRKLGRNPKHQRALLRNLASALFLTERDEDLYDTTDPLLPKPPKVKGRIVTTLAKAKEVQPLVERCISIARRALPHQDAADRLEPDADRGSEKWHTWRESPGWQEWNRAVAPAVAARRRALRLLGSKEAVQILFEDVAPRFEDRPGGYTRVMRLATPRLGDAGTRAILEFVGVRDRVRRESVRPSFEEDEEVSTDEAAGDEVVADESLRDEEEAREADVQAEEHAEGAETEPAGEAPEDVDPSAGGKPQRNEEKG
jgi:large subunit ribosomal protein L17